MPIFTGVVIHGGLFNVSIKSAQTNVKVVKDRLLALVQLRTREQAFN